jgi:hypothetical protein
MIAAAAVSAWGMYQTTRRNNALIRYQKRISYQQAALREEQAKAALRSGQSVALQKASEAQKVVGAQRAAFGASGVSVGAGTAGLVEAGTRAVGRQNAYLAHREAALRAWGYRTGAANAQAKAKFLSYQISSPWLSAAGTFAQGAASAAQSYQFSKFFNK